MPDGTGRCRQLLLHQLLLPPLLALAAEMLLLAAAQRLQIPYLITVVTD